MTTNCWEFFGCDGTLSSLKDRFSPQKGRGVYWLMVIRDLGGEERLKNFNHGSCFVRRWTDYAGQVNTDLSFEAHGAKAAWTPMGRERAIIAEDECR